MSEQACGPCRPRCGWPGPQPTRPEACAARGPRGPAPALPSRAGWARIHTGGLACAAGGGHGPAEPGRARRGGFGRTHRRRARRCCLNPSRAAPPPAAAAAPVALAAAAAAAPIALAEAAAGRRRSRQPLAGRGCRAPHAHAVRTAFQFRFGLRASRSVAGMSCGSHVPASVLLRC